MTALYSAAIQQTEKEELTELRRLYTRISGSKNGSAYEEDITFAKGLGTTSELSQRIPAAFKKACKDGLLKGNVSLPTFRRENPLWVSSRFIHFTHPMLEDSELEEHINDKDLVVEMDLVNNIRFRVILGNPHKSALLRLAFLRIFNGDYKVQGSSIQIDGTDIILNLTVQMEKSIIDLQEDVVVGVYLGEASPAVCSLSSNKNITKKIGDYADFFRMRRKIQEERRRVMSCLRMSNGGHGRRKKLEPMDRFTRYEKNFAKKYNHMLSRNIVDFAEQNHAKYIYFEDMQSKIMDKQILKNWSFYQLQEFTRYKGAMKGIEIRLVKPVYCSAEDMENRDKKISYLISTAKEFI